MGHPNGAAHAVGMLLEELNGVACPSPLVRRLERVRVGLSQSDVARLVGTTAQSVCRWEAGDAVPSGELAVRYWLLLSAIGRVGVGEGLGASPRTAS